MHHCPPRLSTVFAHPVAPMITLVLEEIVAKALKISVVVDNLKAALSGCRLGKRLGGFFEVPFQLSDFTNQKVYNTGGLQHSLTLKPSFQIPTALLPLSDFSPLQRFGRSSSGTIPTSSLHARRKRALGALLLLMTKQL